MSQEHETPGKRTGDVYSAPPHELGKPVFFPAGGYPDPPPPKTARGHFPSFDTNITALATGLQCSKEEMEEWLQSHSFMVHWDIYLKECLVPMRETAAEQGKKLDTGFKFSQVMAVIQEGERGISDKHHAFANKANYQPIDHVAYFLVNCLARNKRDRNSPFCRLKRMWDEEDLYNGLWQVKKYMTKLTSGSKEKRKKPTKEKAPTMASFTPPTSCKKQQEIKDEWRSKNEQRLVLGRPAPRMRGASERADSTDELGASCKRQRRENWGIAAGNDDNDDNDDNDLSDDDLSSDTHRPLARNPSGSELPDTEPQVILTNTGPAQLPEAHTSQPGN